MAVTWRTCSRRRTGRRTNTSNKSGSRWLRPGERYQLTAGKKSSTGPQWSPDSRRLAFTSDRDGKRQIYLIAPAGGEAAQLTNEEAGVGAMAWSPDGASIAFTSSGPESKAMKERKEKYGDFFIVGGDYAMNHIWRVKVPAELPSDVKKLPKAERSRQGKISA